MNHFFNLGSTVQGGVGPKMAIFLPTMTKHGELFNVAKWSKTAQNVQLDLFGPFQAKFNFPLKRTSAKEPYVFSGHCFYFWLKSSKRVQMDTLWFQIMNNLYISCFGPFGPFQTTLQRWQTCHVWPFLVLHPSPISPHHSAHPAPRRSHTTHPSSFLQLAADWCLAPTGVCT